MIDLRVFLASVVKQIFYALIVNVCEQPQVSFLNVPPLTEKNIAMKNERLDRSDAACAVSERIFRNKCQQVSKYDCSMAHDLFYDRALFT